jgi:hypothetical protein
MGVKTWIYAVRPKNLGQTPMASVLLELFQSRTHLRPVRFGRDRPERPKTCRQSQAYGRPIDFERCRSDDEGSSGRSGSISDNDAAGPAMETRQQPDRGLLQNTSPPSVAIFPRVMVRGTRTRTPFRSCQCFAPRARPTRLPPDEHGACRFESGPGQPRSVRTGRFRPEYGRVETCRLRTITRLRRPRSD